MSLAIGAVAGALGCASLPGAAVQDVTTRGIYSNADGSRAFVLFTPASLPRQGSERALVVMLHGCTQSADDMARGTRMNAAAVKSAMHSGLPALSAIDAAGAVEVMQKGAAGGDSLGLRALAVMGVRARPIPVIVLHGAADRVVSPANLEAVRRQWTIVNRGAQPVEAHLFDGVGHAWSGGSATGSYTAPAGPDATALIVGFLARVGVLRPR